ncbi:MAG: flagellar filament capping protein FliD, partial [Bdellovibrionales bacterium]|nr:flagellar filament capping protein FliD [Bdellovibrionales bacterium]
MAGSISFPGIGSGIDGSSIAQALFDQLTLQNAPRQNQIEALQSENSALDQLNTLLLGVADAIDPFRTINGGGSVKGASTSNKDVATATAGSNAETGSFDISVKQLADNASGSFATSFKSGSDFIVSGAANTGDVTFTVGEGDDAQQFTVSVDELTTAEDFVDEVNAKSGGSVSAALVNTGTNSDPSYKITFQTTQSGTENGSLSVSASDGLGADLGTATIDQASNAIFEIEGISGQIERSSNNIDDVISGVSFQLQGTGTATISIKEDAGSAADQLEAFVSAFNSLVEFANKEDAVEVTQQNGETVNIAGALAGTNIDDSALSAIRSAISSAVSGDGSTSLASLGVSTNQDGTLSFDRDAFEAKFNQNPDSAAQALTSLADQLGGATGSIQQFTGFGKLIDGAQDANNGEMQNLQDTISKVERSATSR